MPCFTQLHQQALPATCVAAVLSHGLDLLAWATPDTLHVVRWLSWERVFAAQLPPRLRKAGTIAALAWSPDSKALAVALAPAASTSDDAGATAPEPPLLIFSLEQRLFVEAPRSSDGSGGSAPSSTRPVLQWFVATSPLQRHTALALPAPQALLECGLGLLHPPEPLPPLDEEDEDEGPWTHTLEGEAANAHPVLRLPQERAWQWDLENTLRAPEGASEGPAGGGGGSNGKGREGGDDIPARWGVRGACWEPAGLFPPRSVLFSLAQALQPLASRADAWSQPLSEALRGFRGGRGRPQLPLPQALAGLLDPLDVLLCSHNSGTGLALRGFGCEPLGAIAGCEDDAPAAPVAAACLAPDLSSSVRLTANGSVHYTASTTRPHLRTAAGLALASRLQRLSLLRGTVFHLSRTLAFLAGDWGAATKAALDFFKPAEALLVAEQGPLQLEHARAFYPSSPLPLLTAELHRLLTVGVPTPTLPDWLAGSAAGDAALAKLGKTLGSACSGAEALCVTRAARDCEAALVALAHMRAAWGAAEQREPSAAAAAALTALEDALTEGLVQLQRLRSAVALARATWAAVIVWLRSLLRHWESQAAAAAAAAAAAVGSNAAAAEAARRAARGGAALPLPPDMALVRAALEPASSPLVDRVLPTAPQPRSPPNWTADGSSGQTTLVHRLGLPVPSASSAVASSGGSSAGAGASASAAAAVSSVPPSFDPLGLDFGSAMGEDNALSSAPASTFDASPVWDGADADVDEGASEAPAPRALGSKVVPERDLPAHDPLLPLSVTQHISGSGSNSLAARLAAIQAAARDVATVVRAEAQAQLLSLSADAGALGHVWELPPETEEGAVALALAGAAALIDTAGDDDEDGGRWSHVTLVPAIVSGGGEGQQEQKQRLFVLRHAPAADASSVTVSVACVHLPPGVIALAAAGYGPAPGALAAATHAAVIGDLPLPSAASLPGAANRGLVLLLASTGSSTLSSGYHLLHLRHPYLAFEEVTEGSTCGSAAAATLDALVEASVARVRSLSGLPGLPPPSALAAAARRPLSVVAEVTGPRVVLAASGPRGAVVIVTGGRTATVFDLEEDEEDGGGEEGVEEAGHGDEEAQGGESGGEAMDDD